MSRSMMYFSVLGQLEACLHCALYTMRDRKNWENATFFTVRRDMLVSRSGYQKHEKSEKGVVKLTC